LVLVAIVGGSGSGKTSVTKNIVDHFGDRASMLNMDDYYKDLPPQVNPYKFNFDDPKAFDFELLRTHLEDLKKERQIEMPVYNMVTFRREDGVTRNFKPNDLILVEGIFTLHDDKIANMFDFSVYIDAPSDERLIRRIERDTIERGRTVESILSQYRKFVAPSFKSFIEPQKFKCDIVLPEGVNNIKGMNIIKNAIERMLETKSQEGDQ